jgi:hypothetical protein
MFAEHVADAFAVVGALLLFALFAAVVCVAVLTYKRLT